MKRDEDIHASEAWRRDLEAAGWREVMMHVWKSPSGALFRGPYGAWKRMHECPELTTKRAER